VLLGGGFWRGSVKAETIASLIVIAFLDYLDQNFNVLNLKNLVAVYLPVADLSVYSNYRSVNQISAVDVNSADDKIKITFKGDQGSNLTIYNRFRYVAQTLPNEIKSSFNIAGYAWDGNSYPGNEYWKDSLSSFDSTAILCSNLGQFQNPEVNVELAEPERIKIY
jgi:hypothetical protein